MPSMEEDNHAVADLRKLQRARRGEEPRNTLPGKMAHVVAGAHRVIADQRGVAEPTIVQTASSDAISRSRPTSVHGYG